MEEMLDVYDKNKVKTGKIIKRKSNEKLQDGEYVLTVQCWIVNAKKEILITRRNFEKTYGGMWEATGGCVSSGETSLQGIQRELKEEIGLDMEEKNLKLLRSEIDGDIFRDIYLVQKDIKLDELNFSDNEVVDAKYVKIDEFKNMLENHEILEWLGYFVDEYKKL